MHESSEISGKLEEPEDIVVGGRVGVNMRGDVDEISVTDGYSACYGVAKAPLGSLQCAQNECAVTGGTHSREVLIELAADSGKVV